jgi:hypothetical protein
MTDYEKLKALLDGFGVGYEEYNYRYHKFDSTGLMKNWAANGG